MYRYWYYKYFRGFWEYWGGVKLAEVGRYIQHTLLAGYPVGWWFVAVAILQTDILFYQLDGAWGESRWWWWPCRVFQTKVTRRCSSSWCRATPSSSTPLRWSLTSSNQSREYSSILSCSHNSRYKSLLSYYPQHTKREDKKVKSVCVSTSAFKSFQNTFNIFITHHFSSADIFFSIPFSWMGADVGRCDWLLIIRVV